MRRSHLTPLLLLAASSALAAPPAFEMNHQGFLLGNNDEPVNDASLEMTFRIYDVELPVGVQVEFWKAVCVVSVSGGYYSVSLGGDTCGNEVDSSAIPFGEDRFLEIEVDGNRLLPRLRLSSVPNAANAAALGGLTPDQYWKKSDALEGSGAGFTDLDASALATGTVPDARLSSNVMLANKEQTVTGLKTFAAPGAPFAVGSTTKVDKLNADLLDGQDSSVFATKAELSSPGTVNTAANPVDWTKLKNVPAGFADGTDADTKYSNGSGLSLSGTTFSIANSGVTNAMLASNAVTDVKIASNAVTAAKIASNAVTTAKILNSNVTADKLASNAVTTAKIENGAVTTAKLGSCSDNQVLFKSGSSWVCKSTVALRAVHIDCDSAGEWTFSAQCQSRICGLPTVRSLDCAGNCVNGLPRTCNNPVLGRFVAP